MRIGDAAEARPLPEIELLDQADVRKGGEVVVGGGKAQRREAIAQRSVQLLGGQMVLAAGDETVDCDSLRGGGEAATSSLAKRSLQRAVFPSIFTVST